uniref:Uncharacterized protein n=1 Tax=Arundo donax TaxID=35708 RepID=A0A0A9H4K0_ARUDO
MLVILIFVNTVVIDKRIYILCAWIHTWYAEVAAPKMKSGGKEFLLMMCLLG